ncbi:hypothetical protein Deiofobo_0384 [Pseudomonas phage Deifobo]|nr:hypothetical protein Deiofobo_0384 [Pseudomonas phage Deifobo]
MLATFDLHHTYFLFAHLRSYVQAVGTFEAIQYFSSPVFIVAYHICNNLTTFLERFDKHAVIEIFLVSVMCA